MDMNYSFNASEQRDFQQIVERRQVKEFMNTYSNLVQRCFEDCVTDFTSKSLASKEDTCITRCVDKFVKSSERVGARFAELNAAPGAFGPK
ncbi:putative mitochondrial import inner membrane translocase subunit [Kalaharituber pfeilii]|nr:putative mitochondrial import inner membrane translocase subunit [Kalaharituber pfeilii]